MRTLSLLLLIMLTGMVYALPPPDPGKFSELSGQGGVIVFMDDFESKAGWSLPESFEVEEGSGRNLTKALAFERKSLSEKYALASIPLRLEPEQRYEVTVSYRLENVAPKEGASTLAVDFLAVEFSRDGKYHSGKYVHVPYHNRTTEWAEARIEFDNPAGTTAFLRFYLNRNLTGKIYIDDVIIRTTGPAPALVYPLQPPGFRLPADGKFRFHVDSIGIPENHGLLYASINGKVKTAPVKEMTAELDFGVFSADTADAVTMEVMVMDLKSKTIRGKDTFTFYRTQEAAPANAAEIMPSEHIAVRGEKFLPLGVFTSRLTDADIRKIADGGFNTILRYAPLTATRRLEWHVSAVEDNSPVGLLQRMLDLLEKHNLKLIFSLYEQRGGRQAANRLGSAEGVDAVTEYAVNRFKTHPALLAWYVSDENPASEVPRLIEMRRLISANDPFHPVITLTHRLEDYRIFGKTGDIFMIDQYPIQNHESRSMSEIRRHIREARRNGLPLWMAVQSFNWGAFRSAQFDSYRYPTETEMRSMALLGLNNGVTGILFYSYSSIFELQEKHDPGSSGSFWQSLVAAARPIRRFEKFFLSDEKVPEMEVSVLSGQVEARAYTFKGKTIVVITGDGPGESKAEIKITAAPGLRSEYGLTENTGNGKYLFTGKDICSDIIH